MIPGLGNALREIGEKHEDEPDFGARDWTFENDDEAEEHGDVWPDEEEA
jgi:hypothetical protein